MGFCRNCGNEIPDGTKFCPNCGTPVAVETTSYSNEDFYQPKTVKQSDDKFYTSNVYSHNGSLGAKDDTLAIDKFGKFFGIILLILSFVDFYSDPAILTIILSVAIISGCIFCFARKYKLKGFTIIALILAVICLLCGIYQAKKVGLFKIPEDVKTEEIVVENPVEEPKISVTEPVKEETSTKKEEQKVEVEESAQEEESIPEDVTSESEGNKESVNGVDPELKAFLDSYEEFMDEYVDFMKKYMADPGNAISMLSEYSDIMSKYEEFAEAVDAYDSKEMSTEDAKYYLEVINRCNQKLLDIY